MRSFVASLEVASGHKRSTIKNKPNYQNQNGPKGHIIRTKLALEASKSGLNSPDGPVSPDQNGPKGQTITSGPTGPQGQYIRNKLRSSTSTLDLNRDLKSKLEI